MERILISVSSFTGNTRKLAEALIKEFTIRGYEPEIVEARDACSMGELPPADLVIVCFWCRKAGMDDHSKILVEKLSGKHILAFGTMGSYTRGIYADSVRDNVKAFIARKNYLDGLFLCRGRIAPERTEKRRSLPKDHPHYLNDASYERHLTSRSHPDQKDLAEAAAYLREKMNW